MISTLLKILSVMSPKRLWNLTGAVAVLSVIVIGDAVILSNVGFVRKAVDIVLSRVVWNPATSIELSRRMSTIVANLRNRTDADRAFVTMLHNGKVGPDGVHFAFFSRIAESVAPGIASLTGINQGFPASVFYGYMDALQSGQCALIDVDDPRTEYRAYFRSIGVQYMIACTIRDTNGQIAGLIGVEYVKSKPEDDQALARMKELAPFVQLAEQTLADVKSEVPFGTK